MNDMSEDAIIIERMVENKAEEWKDLASKLKKHIDMTPYEDVKIELRIASRTWDRAGNQLLQMLRKLNRRRSQTRPGPIQSPPAEFSEK